MGFFPILARFEHSLVVGGGTVAARKVSRLLSRNIDVIVVAPEICEKIRLSGAKTVCRSFCDEDLHGCDVVFVATDDRVLNEHIASLCRKNKIPVNVADVPELCDFYVPAIIEHGDAIVSVSTCGKSPAFARKLRERLESVLPEDLENSLKTAADYREKTLSAGKTPSKNTEYTNYIEHLFDYD